MWKEQFWKRGSIKHTRRSETIVNDKWPGETVILH